MKTLVFSLVLGLCRFTMLAQTPSDGEFSKFSTKGHPKAKGTSFTISYPRGWTASEDEAPRTVQTFTGGTGSGFESIRILVMPLPPESDLSDDGIKKLLSPEGLKQAVPANAKLLRTAPIKVDGAPAGIVECSIHGARNGIEADLHTITLILFRGRSMVQVQGQIGGLSAKAAEVAARFDSFRPRFLRIADSIVFDKL